MSTKQTKQTYDGPDERPKALRYRDRINAVEEMIVDALPDITRKLISMAKECDVAAARYLVDRMAGRPSKLPTPPSLDRTIPYTALDWSADLLERKDRRDSKAAVFMSSIWARDNAPEAQKKPNSFPGLGPTPSMDVINQGSRSR